MVADVDVLRPRVFHVVLCNKAGADVVDVGLNRKVHVDDLVNQVETTKYKPSLTASDRAMYSASVLEMDTVACLETRKFKMEPL